MSNTKLEFVKLRFANNISTLFKLYSLYSNKNEILRGNRMI